MGGQVQQNTGSQVYFDPESQQYYTLNTPKNNLPSGMNSILSPLYNIATNSSKYRNYILNPYNKNTSNTSTVSSYPSTESLFPGLNAGLLVNLLQGSQPDGAMYGAGKYLTGTNLLTMPTTTSESKGK